MPAGPPPSHPRRADAWPATQPSPVCWSAASPLTLLPPVVAATPRTRPCRDWRDGCGRPWPPCPRSWVAPPPCPLTWAARPGSSAQPNEAPWPCGTAAVCSLAATDPWAWCEAHHVRHWLDGGPTDLGNLALVCRAHHRAIHDGGWQLIRGPDGRFSATPPYRQHPALV